MLSPEPSYELHDPSPEVVDPLLNGKFEKLRLRIDGENHIQDWMAELEPFVVMTQAQFHFYVSGVSESPDNVTTMDKLRNYAYTNSIGIASTRYYRKGDRPGPNHEAEGYHAEIVNSWRTEADDGRMHVIHVPSETVFSFPAEYTRADIEKAKMNGRRKVALIALFIGIIIGVFHQDIKETLLTVDKVEIGG